ncbi:hypothetical protein SAMN05660299_00921 [Megasphaera paucivorans]|uniref:Uncharacterized protein n=1 Tax=Megasphaera paucivorans TaxID=349095 RepID=A0A1G9TF41_9FIRM|nr:HAD family hydrolase [Megasphaera paucivorans]SDM46371.1 hypothetical protein SAMN05660299_00921 [Megasphaera paucivorans]
MKKYFFFDIDGTLAVGTTKLIPKDTIFCLNQLKQAGHFVAIATGRLQCDTLQFSLPLHINSFVADGGSSLTYNGKLLEMSGLPRQQAISLLQDLDSCHISWAVTLENKTIRYTRSTAFANNEKKSYFKTIVCPLDPLKLHTIYKIFYINPSHAVPQPQKHGLSHIPYTENSLLVEPTDKAAGIRRMMKKINAPLHDVVVFGDGLNDINMFTPAWFSIAMGNACPELKEKANYITDTCDTGGILHACQKYGWL